MSSRDEEKCEYARGNSCLVVTQGVLKSVRDESCAQEQKDLCCYVCPSRGSCEIRCDMLDKFENRSPINHAVSG